MNPFQTFAHDPQGFAPLVGGSMHEDLDPADASIGTYQDLARADNQNDAVGPVGSLLTGTDVPEVGALPNNGTGLPGGSGPDTPPTRSLAGKGPPT